MASKALTVTMRIEGARQTLAAFRRLPDEANKSLRERSFELASSLAGKVAAAARADSPQSALMARTVKAQRDRVPTITAGGSTRVGRHRTPAWALLFGSEFGANGRFGWYAKPRYDRSAGRQYKPHLGRGSYWFFRTIEDSETQIAKAWQRVADDIVREFERG